MEQERILVAFELNRSSRGSQNLTTGNEMINANDRMHFHVRSKITEHLRSLANLEARQQIGDLSEEKYSQKNIPVMSSYISHRQPIAEWTHRTGIPL